MRSRLCKTSGGSLRSGPRSFRGKAGSLSSWIGRIPHLIDLKRLLSKKWAFMMFFGGAQVVTPRRLLRPMRLRRNIPGLLARGALLLACCGWLALVCAYAAPAQDGCASAPAPGAAGDHSAAIGRVKAVNERLGLTLEDGRLLKLAGLDPPRPTPDTPDIDVDSSAKLAGRQGGRLPPFERAAGSLGPIRRSGVCAARRFGLAHTTACASRARGGPRAFRAGCRRPCLAAPSCSPRKPSPRAGALGLWADPYYAVIAAGDHDAFAEKAGTSVIVEGRVVGVEEGAFRTTLLFGQRWGQDFSVTILQRNAKIFSAAGLSLASFKGQTIRVRGLLDMRFGPQVEVSDPDEIEAITQATDEAGPESAPRR